MSSLIGKDVVVCRAEANDSENGKVVAEVDDDLFQVSIEGEGKRLCDFSEILEVK